MELIRQVLDPWSARSIAGRAGYCHVCTGMLCTPEGLKSLETIPGYRHYNMHQAIKSAKQGCRLCEIILREGWEHPRNILAGEKQLQLSQETIDRPLWFIWRGGPDSPRDHFTIRYEQDVEGQTRKSLGDKVWLLGGQIAHYKPPQNPDERWSWGSWVSIAVMAPFDDPAANYFPRRPIHDSFLKGDIMTEAKSWLDECVGGRHQRCVPPRKALLPTRVLDVDPGLGSIVRLEEARSGQAERYAALSYCWGGPQPLTATKSNIQTLASGVDIAQLPQTLQDAVYVTRSLGIRYLWIDALCIIQDSLEDKLSEIGKMGTIYRNAVVTIASAHARKASDGFLRVSSGHKPEYSCSMPVHLPDQHPFGRVTLAAEHSLPGEQYPEPLRTRGWAFQEAVLSRRLLIFSDYELQCYCRVEHEKFLNLGNLYRSRPPKLFGFGTKHFDTFETHHKNHGDGWMSALFLGGMWNAMLVEFTSRSLTVSDDRLHALQGIANELLQSKHLSASLDRTYVAGIWMACLPSQLTWSRDNRTALCPDRGILPFQPITSRSKRAPTWSWACLDCPVMFLSVEMNSERPYKGFSLLQAPSESGDGQLEAECDILCRSLDEFRHDLTKNRDIRITLDLDRDELPPEVTCVHYILLDKYINVGGIDEADPLWLYYVSGIVTYETESGFQRLGCFRWEVDQLADDEYTFGQRRRVALV